MDCQQFSSISFGNIACRSKNSSCTVVKSSDGSITTNSWVYPYIDTQNRTPPNLHDAMVIAVVCSVLFTTIFVSFFVIFYRERNRIKEAKINALPGIPELPLGGHNERTELEVRERPGELSVLKSNSAIELDTLHPHANGNVKANITEISDIDFNPFLGESRTRDRTNLPRKNSMEITSEV